MGDGAGMAHCWPVRSDFLLRDDDTAEPLAMQSPHGIVSFTLQLRFVLELVLLLNRPGVERTYGASPYRFYTPAAATGAAPAEECNKSARSGSRLSATSVSRVPLIAPQFPSQSKYSARVPYDLALVLPTC